MWYLGFVSFTTIGYGDPAPRTPAGRSVFVVWALLGVATVTVLISGAYLFFLCYPLLTFTLLLIRFNFLHVIR